MKPKWVIFDVGKVLYNFGQFCADIAKLLGVEEETLLNQVNIQAKLGFRGEISVEEHWRRVLTGINFEHKFREIMDIWNNDSRYWLKDIRVLFRELKTAGYNLAILTNNWTNQTAFVRKAVSQFVDPEFVFESAVLKMQKPEVQLFKYVENKIAAKKQEILYIDDSQEYLEGAKTLDWQTFLYKIGEDLGKTSNDLIRKELLN